MAHVAGPDIGEKATSLFQPDVLLPAQYFETGRQKSVAVPEKSFMAAVFEEAVYSFQKYLLVPDGKGRILFEEAGRWIFDDDDSGLFSYRNVCEILDIEVDYLPWTSSLEGEAFSSSGP